MCFLAILAKSGSSYSNPYLLSVYVCVCYYHFGQEGVEFICILVYICKLLDLYAHVAPCYLVDTGSSMCGIYMHIYSSYLHVVYLAYMAYMPNLLACLFLAHIW